MIKSYIDKFSENWLFESPQHTGSSIDNNPYQKLVDLVSMFMQQGIEAQSLGDNMYGLFIDNDNIYIWIENKEIDIIATLTKFNKGYAIGLVGKRTSATVYASDISKLNNSLLFSGDIISTEAIKIWKRLLGKGHKLLAYNPKMN